MLDLKKLLANVARDRGQWGHLMRGLGPSAKRPETSTRPAPISKRFTASAPTRATCECFSYLPPRACGRCSARRRAARMHTDCGRLRSRSRMVDARRPLRLRPAVARAAAIQQSQRLLQLVSARRHRARPRRMLVDPADGRSHGRRTTASIRRRVFITGLSAGGAMTSVMLACYPEVFAGGAIIAGLPYGAATNVQQAFESMYQCPTRSRARMGRPGSGRVTT